MLKPMSFGEYKRLTKLPLNQFNIWVEAFYQAAYEDGKSSSAPDTNAFVYDEDELYLKLTEVDGVSKGLARTIIRKLTEG